MDANLGALTNIAIVALVAVALGLILVRLRQPPMVGYILAGAFLGPTALGLVDQTQAITLLAEIGVLLLLFLIGMELSLRAFVVVLRPAVFAATLQIAAALAITFAFGLLVGWSAKASILLGFAVAVSSTALAVKMLEDVGELRTKMGRITIGVLIAQDIAIVPILLFSESLGAGQGVDGWLIGRLAAAVLGLFLLIAYLSRPGRIVLPFSDRIRHRADLLTLTMLAICLAGAAISGVFGLSPVYGAFVAGLVVGKSSLRSEAIPATQPVQSLLIFVFFLSIGLLIDLDFLAANWLLLLLFVLAIVVVKSVLNVAILRFVGEPWERAFPAGLIMAQVGEFSFVIAAVGLSSGTIGYPVYQVAIAVIAVSLLVSPFWLVSVRRFHEVAERGVESFRAALAEVYVDELAEIERGAARIEIARRALARWGRALQRTIMRTLADRNGHRLEREQQKQLTAPASPEAPSHPAATEPHTPDPELANAIGLPKP